MMNPLFDAHDAEAWPALTMYWLLRRVVLHKVPDKYLRWVRWNRMWISFSDCGVLCLPPNRDIHVTVEWCTKCYPFGPWPITSIP
ncbi:hypothetical protein ACPZ19_04705 [Amycolatopsis lurida]